MNSAQKMMLITGKQSSFQHVTHIFRNLVSRPFSTTLHTKNIQINVSPKEALLDNPPHIEVQGLKDSQKVTLWNTYTDDSGLEFSCHAHYIANKEGKIDAKNDLSYGGRYKGVFAEGLVSALQSAPPTYKKKYHLKYARLYKKNVTEPMKYTLSVVDGHVSEEELYSERKESPIGETTFYRHLMADGVRRKEIEENNLRGVLFLPKGEGPFPLVLDLFGAESGIKEFRSAMLASYGYASIVLPYYNYKDLPPLSHRIDLDYFLEGIDYLNGIPEGNSGKIGLIGSSKGGELGLTLCGLTDKLKACVSINAYNRTIDIDYFLNNKLFLEKYVGDPRTGHVYVNDDGEFIAYGSSKMYLWDTPHILPIDKINDDCEVLIAAGDEDGGHAHRSAIGLKERARRFNKNKVSALIYPGAGHLLDPPFHSHMKAIWNTTILIRQEDGSRHTGLAHFYGGNPYSTCQATKDLWKRTLALFHKRLVQEANLPVQNTKLYPPY